MTKCAACTAVRPGYENKEEVAKPTGAITSSGFSFGGATGSAFSFGGSQVGAPNSGNFKFGGESTAAPAVAGFKPPTTTATSTGFTFGGSSATSAAPATFSFGTSNGPNVTIGADAPTPSAAVVAQTTEKWQCDVSSSARKFFPFFLFLFIEQEAPYCRPA